MNPQYVNANANANVNANNLGKKSQNSKKNAANANANALNNYFGLQPKMESKKRHINSNNVLNSLPKNKIIKETESFEDLVESLSKMKQPQSDSVMKPEITPFGVHNPSLLTDKIKEAKEDSKYTYKNTDAQRRIRFGDGALIFKKFISL